MSRAAAKLWFLQSTFSQEVCKCWLRSNLTWQCWSRSNGHASLSYLIKVEAWISVGFLTIIHVVTSISSTFVPYGFLIASLLYGAWSVIIAFRLWWMTFGWLFSCCRLWSIKGLSAKRRPCSAPSTLSAAQHRSVFDSSQPHRLRARNKVSFLPRAWSPYNLHMYMTHIASL